MFIGRLLDMYACIYGQRSGLYMKRKALAKIIALFAYIPHNATVLSAGAHFSGRAEVTTNQNSLTCPKLPHL